MNHNDEEYKRIKWKCRRGMLELDIILEKFIDHHYFDLSQRERQLFADLLETADPVLYAWFLGAEQPKDAGLLAIVNKIRSLT